MPQLIRRTKPRQIPALASWVDHPKYGLCVVDALAHSPAPRPTTIVSLLDRDRVRRFAKVGDLTPSQAPDKLPRHHATA